MSSYRTKIPFGIAQIGRSFRNEITPKQFLFRTREFEQMELEWFCRPEHSADDFVYWLNQRKEFYKKIGLSSERTRFRAHEQDELAHYSKACTDVEFYFPFGWKELEGIAHRGAYDLSQHTTHSKKDLSVYDDETKESYVPHVVESSVGSDRLMLALLCDAYCEEVVDEDTRVVLKLHPAVAPITAAFLPLTKKLSDPLRAVYQRLRDKGYSVQFDETGSIGKRYRRQDEIGTPLCFTYDFDSEQDHSVTVRHRDTMEQSRVAIDDIEHIVCDAITL
jgi:glycyl-tRNA synthetase